MASSACWQRCTVSPVTQFLMTDDSLVCLFWETKCYRRSIDFSGFDWRFRLPTESTIAPTRILIFESGKECTCHEFCNLFLHHCGTVTGNDCLCLCYEKKQKHSTFQNWIHSLSEVPCSKTFRRASWCLDYSTEVEGSLHSSSVKREWGCSSGPQLGRLISHWVYWSLEESSQVCGGLSMKY